MAMGTRLTATDMAIRLTRMAMDTQQRTRMAMVIRRIAAIGATTRPVSMEGIGSPAGLRSIARAGTEHPGRGVGSPACASSRAAIGKREARRLSGRRHASLAYSPQTRSRLLAQRNQ